MVDVGLRGGPNYGVVLRKTDASQTIRLGEGSAQKLSPDGKWAAAIIQEPAQVVIYPTGAGDATRIRTAPIDRLISAEWFPDGRRLLVCGSEASHAPRCYSLDRAGSPPAPVTPEGALATLAPDGRQLLLALADGRFQLAAIDGGAPRPVQGLTPEDRHIAWSRDGAAVYVQQGLQVPAKVDRVVPVDGGALARARVDAAGPGIGRRALCDRLGRRGPVVRVQLHEPAVDAVCRQWCDPVDCARVADTGAAPRRRMAKGDDDKPGGMGGKRSAASVSAKKPAKKAKKATKKR